MLTKLVANSFEFLLELAMWITLAIGALQGYAVGRELGLIIGLLAAMVPVVAVFGTLSLLLEIRKDVKKIALSCSSTATKS